MAYKRFFIPLANEAPGYEFKGRKPAGRCILEEQNGLGKISLWVQDLRPQTRYAVFLIFADGNKYAGVNAGPLVVDDKGKGETRRDIEKPQLHGFVLQEVVAVAVMATKTTRVESPLCGYRGDAVVWKHNFYEKAGIKKAETAVTPIKTEMVKFVFIPPIETEIVKPVHIPPIETEMIKPVLIPIPDDYSELFVEETDNTTVLSDDYPELLVDEVTIPVVPPDIYPELNIDEEIISIEPPLDDCPELFIDEAAITTESILSPDEKEALSELFPKINAAPVNNQTMSIDETSFNNQTMSVDVPPVNIQTISIDEPPVNIQTTSVDDSHPALSKEDFCPGFSSLRPMSPFTSGNDVGIKWVRFTPVDNVPAPDDKPGLFTEPFVTSSFDIYAHFILGQMKDEEGMEYVIGVPGRYGASQQAQAVQLGFSEFKCYEDIAPAEDEFGYWLMFVG